MDAKSARNAVTSKSFGDVEESNANIDETVENFNYRPKTSIKEGISNFVDWYLDNQDTLEKNGI